MENPAGLERVRTQSRARLLHCLQRDRFDERLADRFEPAQARQDRSLDAVRDSEERKPDRRRFLGRGPRLAHPSSRIAGRPRLQLPDRDALHDQRLTARSVGSSRRLRRGGLEHAAPRDLHRREGFQRRRHPARDPEFRSLHAVHHAHPRREPRHLARDQHLRLRRG